MQFCVGVRSDLDFLQECVKEISYWSDLEK